MAESLSQQTAKNSIYGLLSYVVPIGFTIVITPLIIQKLGVEQYGIFVLASVITGFFGLFKFGLGYGVTKAVSQYHGDRKIAGVSEIVSSTFVLFAIIGTLGLIASSLIGLVGLDWINVSPEYAKIGATLFTLSGVAFLFSSINSTFTNAIAASQRLDIYTKIYLGGMIFLNVGMLGLLFTGYGIVSLVMMQMITNILLFGIYRIALRRLLPEVKLRLRYSHSWFKPYIALNAYAYLHEAATTLLFEFDKVLVATVTGPVAVSYYSIAGTVGQKIQGSIGSLTSIIMPVSSALSAKNEGERIKEIYKRAMRIVMLITSSLTVAVISFGPEILRYWVGPDFEKNSLHALNVLAVTYFLLAIFTVFGHFLLGIGEVKKLAYYTALFAGLNLIFLFILLPIYGINGAAWAYLLCLTPLPYILASGERLLEVTNRAQFYLKHGLQIITAGVIMYIAGRFIAITIVTSFPTLILYSGLWLISYVFVYRFFRFLSDEDWQLITLATKKMFLKK